MSNILDIDFIKIHKDAKIPVYELDGDAACSLRVVEDYVIAPNQRILAKTGLKISIPEGFEAQVRPRGGNAWKKGLTVLNTPGTIDSNYQGEIMIILINLGSEKIFIRKHDAVAQMKFSPVYIGRFREVSSFELETNRGEGRLGHTGD